MKKTIVLSICCQLLSTIVFSQVIPNVDLSDVQATKINVDAVAKPFLESEAIEGGKQVALTSGLAPAAIAASTTALGNGDPGAGGVMMSVNQSVRDIWRHMKQSYQWVQSHVVQSETSQNVVGILQLQNKVKNAVGYIGATIGSLHNLQQTLKNDLSSKTNVTEQLMNEVNDYLSWKDALAGYNGKPTTYSPIIDFQAMYESETSVFRDASGNLSLGQGLASAVDDRQLALHMANYQQQLINTKKNQYLIHDMEVRDHFRQALQYERRARLLTIKVNTQLFKRNIGDIANSFKFLTSSRAWSATNADQSFYGLQSDGTMNTQLSSFDTRLQNFVKDNPDGDKTTVSSSGSVVMTDKELSDTMREIQDCMNKAQFHRSEGNAKLYQLLRAQMNPFNLDLYKIRMIQMQKAQIESTLQQQQTKLGQTDLYSTNSLNSSNYNSYGGYNGFGVNGTSTTNISNYNTTSLWNSMSSGTNK